MRDVKYGANPLEFPPVEAHRAQVQAYEQAGLDFVAYWDQTCLTIPKALWTPDLCPAANLFHIDSWLEPWPLLTDAALATERMELYLAVSDVVRRPPSVLAQLALTLDQYSKGRFKLGLGAGESKQSIPYGIPRDKPFGRLEETLKLLRLWFGTNETIDYDGSFWTVKEGGISTPAYTPGGPKLFVGGGPGKALKFSSTLADGWFTYFPAETVEAYAEEVQQFYANAREVGRDPEPMMRMFCGRCVIGETEEHVEEMLRSPILRFETAALVPGGETWRRHGHTNPIGDDYSYPRDLRPMSWTREEALAVAEQVPVEMVRNLNICGTPEQVADQLQRYVEAGANHIIAADYGGLVTVGDMDDAAQVARRLHETYDHMRRLNGQPTKLAASSAAG